MSIIDVMRFIREEVKRQGFKPDTSEFWMRVGAMAAAWNYARFRRVVSETDRRRPTVDQVCVIGMMVEPETNYSGWRRAGVQVGGYIAPPPDEVPSKMAKWAELSKTMTADEAYVAFEEIHPFADGNGRTGKIIHNWLLGTLDEPVLIKDYFGGGLP